METRIMNGTVLVATDGTPQSLGALRLARRLEERDGRRIEVVTVVEPVPIYDTGFMVALPEAELFEARRDTVEAEIRDQLEEVTGSRSPWPVHVEPGIPASRIVGLAETLEAEFLLMGIGRHGSMDRLFGRETALQVIRLAHLPVLAAPPGCDTLPRKAVLAVDFSSFSARAAAAVKKVLKSPAELHLVHAISGLEFVPTASGDWHPKHLERLRARLEAFAGSLDLPDGWSVQSQVLEGEPSHEILAYASSVEADLLVAGSHGHSFMGRLLMGSVSTRLIRGSTCSVLIAPPEDVPHEVRTGPVGETADHPWVNLLKNFTARNTGRRTELELDHPGFGAQHSGRDYPLWGVVYEPRGDRVEIMLGEQGSVERRITHSIPGPRNVEILTDDEGHDEALRITLDEGQVLLRLQRG
jgi:nucleotide-binding universal stress UspA family protein